MKAPDNVKIYNTLTSDYWFDENGIFCSVSKKAIKPSLEETKEYIKEFKSIVGNKKVCMLIDVTYTSESTKEVRDYVAEELPGFVKAIAMISGSPLGKMLANLFFRVKVQPYPTKMFSNEQDAKEWLKQYL